MDMLIIIILGYLLGAIPFGLVLAYLGGYGDIRKIGSGNIGATNVLRTGNKPLALATLLLDSGKGAIAVGLSATLLQTNIINVNGFSPTSLYILAAFGAIIGHCFPIWLKFKGGKGVATTLGGLLAAMPLVGLACSSLWLLTAVLSRISSLSALVALLGAPLFAQLLYNDVLHVTLPTALITLLVWIKHHQNITRIIKGTEPKIGKKSKPVAQAD
jgi:glycerol-3-phosphate acyltransferase PlsY